MSTFWQFQGRFSVVTGGYFQPDLKPTEIDTGDCELPWPLIILPRFLIGFYCESWFQGMVSDAGQGAGYCYLAYNRLNWHKTGSTGSNLGDRSLAGDWTGSAG